MAVISGADQNSLTNIIGIFGDLGSKLDLLTRERPAVEAEPLTLVMNNIEDLEETFQLFQKEIEEEPNNDLIDEAVEELTRGMKNQLTMENMEGEIQMVKPEIANPFSSSSTVHSIGKFSSSVFGLEGGDEDSKLTYLDVIILLLFILGIFFMFFVIIVFVSYCWRKMFGVRESWKDLGDSETDSSVSWVSINTTTTTEDTPVTPVKPPSQPQDVSTVRAVLQTDIIAPIAEQKILMVPGEFVLDRGTQWCRTQISPSIIV